MPASNVLSRIAFTLVLTTATVACGESGRTARSPSPDPGPTTSVPPSGAPGQTCVASERGYRLQFPSTWHTNDAGIAEPCRFFHPHPFTLAPRTEAVGLAISVRLNPVGFDDVAPSSDGSTAVQVVDRRTATVDGRPAVRAETLATGNGLLPPGTRAVSWFVDAGDATLVATTSEAAEAGHLQDNVKVLDGMVESLRLSDRKSTCSTGRSTPAPTRHPELPQAVSSMRMAIIDAAKACDYGKLAELALAGDGTFNYSFGGSGGPAAFWREAEAEGQAPLRVLVELLDGPSATRVVNGTTHYLWPAAYAFERWEDVPATAREDLRGIYGDEAFRRFERFGSYLGHRIGITASGDWIFFIAGD